MTYKQSRILRFSNFLLEFDDSLWRTRTKKSAILKGIDKLLLLERFIMFVVRFLIKKYLRK